MIRAAPALAVALAACSTPDYGNGQLRCAASAPRCPDGYYCAADDRCWKTNSGPSDGGFDLADGAPSDLARDFANADFANVDLATPDLTTPIDLASSDLMPSLCGSSTALLCEDFESATLSSKWTFESNQGSYAIEPNPYRGNQSLHLHVDATSVNDPGATIRNATIFPLASTVYVRVWAYFAPSLPMVFDQFINFTDNMQGGASYSIHDDFPANNDYSTTQYAESTTVMVPRGKWTCLQYQLPQPAGTGPVRLFVDGNEVTDAAIANANVTSMIALHVGLDLINGGAPLGAADVWVDEIIVDTQPTTCAE